MPQRSEPTNALYVRLPAGEALKLDRAAEALRMRKKDLISSLVSRYIDLERLDELQALRDSIRTIPEPSEREPQVGHMSFHPTDPPEVLTPAQAADLLQVEEEVLLRLAEGGDVPGRRLGDVWRFSRSALIGWLSGS
ncbi:MAG TPA: helix-turn-helix domain-containing protein [Candidatus Dormibacteraeota bacterium]|jgi:excisionase family DNA binding protein|nr:helix-turn-helix domain-containing protein [Candidatus Dormibacteraeota bacterium]